MKQTAETNRRSLARHPLVQIVLSRMREFYREPEAVFWVYGFPLLMVVSLGIAFRNQPERAVAVDIEEGPGSAAAQQALADNARFIVRVAPRDQCLLRLRLGKTDLVVVPAGAPNAQTSATESTAESPSPEPSKTDGSKPSYEYWYDPGKPESALARNSVDDALQRGAGRNDVLATDDHKMTEPGGRYIDFLVPGLLGMSLMGGGLWGVGFVTVDMRIRKLLKRMLATPMRKSHFLAGIMLSRLAFMVPEVLVVLIFSRIAFGVVNQGNLLSLFVLVLLGALSFSGIGLLVASRAKTVEAVSGLMNLVMLPMWVLSGIFFSSDRFPEIAQPFIRALPLTELINALRAVMLEGATLASQAGNVAALAAWGGISFLLALRLFRWN